MKSAQLAVLALCIGCSVAASVDKNAANAAGVNQPLPPQFPDTYLVSEN